MQIVSGTDCQISTDNLTFSGVNGNAKYGGNVDETEDICSIQNLNCSTVYYLRAKNSTTGWNYTSIKTADCGEEEPMAALAIILFIMSLIGTLYIIPIKIEKFTGNPIADFIIKRGCWSLATALLLMGSAMIATIAETAGIEVTNEIFRIMWVVGIALRLLLIWLVFGTLVQTVKYWREQIKHRGVGDEEN